ncbi:hypothetical protein NLU13_7166 [Sarocladium strictum]|uniref:Choline transport protein n=1 Tax=Sarocladium strictum TaxID=5046 RepID=A0AA39GDI4_SARSR|nr:hypothetical protein NLU13_7166 [Sarocladium strictum]
MPDKTKTMTTQSKLRDNESVIAEPSAPTNSTFAMNPHGSGLQKNFSLLSLLGIALVVSNTWAAVGGSILVAIFNGGPPGVLYEFLVVAVFYCFVAASLAELASAIPSSAGVYHWATITPGKGYGRLNGFFAGWWNYLAWVFASASMAFVWSNTTLQIYRVTHPSFMPQPWHVFLIYVISTWTACLLVCFFNSAMPHLNTVGMFLGLFGFLATVISLAVLPGRDTGSGYASHDFVWKDWKADLGYPAGFVFVAGMLNGAYGVGVPDVVSHLAEEIPNPKRNVPLAMALQMAIAVVTGFIYLVVLMYAITDYDTLFESTFPLAEIYLQGTGSTGGCIGLLLVLLLTIGLGMIGLYVTAGRTLWTLSRDHATPFHSRLSKIHEQFHMPLWSTLFTAVLVTVLGCIYVGSTTAFNAFVGTYVLMSSSSYLAAILPHLLTSRRNIVFGPFQMSTAVGFFVNTVACGYMAIWFVIYCFPFSLPVTAANMNYSSLIWGGLTLILGIWWVVVGSKCYRGPDAEVLALLSR